MKKQAVVTGGTGFIGSWLIRELTKRDYEVFAFVRKKRNIFDQNIFQIEYNTDEYNDFVNDHSNVDVFFHLAWDGVAPEKKNERIRQVQNINFAMDMLDVSSKLHAKRFIATGTVAEYSFCEGIMDVNARQSPNDLYGAAKTATHYMLETWARELRQDFNWVVIPSTFGEGRRDNNIITYTIKSLLNNEKPSFGYLTQLWDFLYVEEVVRALCLIAEKGNPDTTYAIGSGIYRPLRYYVERIRDIINPELQLGIGEIPSFSEKVFSSCVSIYNLTKDTGFVPLISFEEGIMRTIPYYKEQINKETAD